MPQNDETRPQGGDPLRPDEVAAEGATELPDREAMSLITGPGGAGPLPFLGQPIQPMPPDTTADPTLPPGPMTIAQDTGRTT